MSKSVRVAEISVKLISHFWLTQAGRVCFIIEDETDTPGIAQQIFAQMRGWA